MGILIANNTGAFNFDAAQVQIDLISIALADVDLGFNETPLINREGFDCIETTYNSLNESGNTPQRIFDLINENGYTSPPDVIIIGDDGSFVLADGTSTTAANGFAMSPGASGAIGSNTNPFANHVCTIYDISLCNGNGMWIETNGGGTSPMTTASLLYHELSHCFRIITNALPLDGSGNVDVTQEEINATIDENDMRSVENLPDRDINSRAGGCGGGTVSCCIIASLATTSPYSNEVVKLRYVRDNFLRNSNVGDAFFKSFFYEYYAFSPEITRLIGHYPTLKEVTKNNFVNPLLLSLDMLVYNKENKGKNLYSFVENQIKQKEDINYKDLILIRNITNSIINGNLTSEQINSLFGKIEGFDQINQYLNLEIMTKEVLKWSLFEPLCIWLEAAINVFDNNFKLEINTNIAISKWISNFPISDIWIDFNRIQLKRELENLGQYMFDNKSRGVFAEKLAKRANIYKFEIIEWSKN
jgi:hypothetical protein